jgi:L-ascorbate metabolism protein UlaG (beta-lactamase superfamily)
MIFARYAIPESYRPSGQVGAEQRAADDALVLRWLGTAGYELRFRGSRLLIDPFLSRPGLSRVAFRRLVPDWQAIGRHLAGADFIACGHSHYDHLMDTPLIAQQYGATVLGSASTCAVARAAGVPDERLIEIPPGGATHRCGPFRIRFVPSLHGRIFAGRVPLPGTIPPGIRLPARAWAYRMGGAYGILVEAGPYRLYHNGSADLKDAALLDEQADVLLVGLAGRQHTAGYLERLIGLLQPSVLVPTHYDAFFAPLEEGLHLLPGIDLDGFYEEAATLAPAAALVMPYPLEALHLRPGQPPVIAGSA